MVGSFEPAVLPSLSSLRKQRLAGGVSIPLASWEATWQHKDPQSASGKPFALQAPSNPTMSFSALSCSSASTSPSPALALHVPQLCRTQAQVRRKQDSVPLPPLTPALFGIPSPLSRPSAKARGELRAVWWSFLGGFSSALPTSWEGLHSLLPQVPRVPGGQSLPSPSGAHNGPGNRLLHLR